MPVLPLIDLMILVGSGSLLVAFVLKGIAITTHYRPGLFGLGAMEFVIIAAICMAFALTLAARTWVKLNEPRLVAQRRGLDARRHEMALEELAAESEEKAPAAARVPMAAGLDQR